MLGSMDYDPGVMVRFDSFETERSIWRDNLGYVEVKGARTVNPDFTENPVVYYESSLDGEQVFFLVGQQKMEEAYDSLRPDGIKNNGVVEPVRDKDLENKLYGFIGALEEAPVENWFRE